MASPTQMHSVLCRSVTIEARFTASSRNSCSHRDWTDLYRASNSAVEGAVVLDDSVLVWLNSGNPIKSNCLPSSLEVMSIRGIGRPNRIFD
jgi:hypothetical protein